MGPTITPTMEDYLETITILNTENKVIRLKDISKRMGVKKSSAHSAMHVLEDNGLVNHEKYGYVELTKKGHNMGEEIYKRHKALTKFLNKILGVDIETAKKDACKIEHAVSKNTMKKLLEAIKKSN